MIYLLLWLDVKWFLTIFAIGNDAYVVHGKTNIENSKRSKATATNNKLILIWIFPPTFFFLFPNKVYVACCFMHKNRIRSDDDIVRNEFADVTRARRFMKLANFQTRFSNVFNDLIFPLIDNVQRTNNECRFYWTDLLSVFINVSTKGNRFINKITISILLYIWLICN